MPLGAARRRGRGRALRRRGGGTPRRAPASNPAVPASARASAISFGVVCRKRTGRLLARAPLAKEELELDGPANGEAGGKARHLTSSFRRGLVSQTVPVGP